MATEKVQSGVDIIKVYIWGMAALTLIVFVWMVINYFLLQKYREKSRESIEILNEIKTKEKNLAEMQYTPAEDIPNEYGFFMRTVHGLSETPKVTIRHWMEQSLGNRYFEEKNYTISFETGSTRSQLARYIYTIQKEKPFLKVKELKIWKTESTASPEDKWNAEIVFAMRRPLQRKTSND